MQKERRLPFNRAAVSADMRGAHKNYAFLKKPRPSFDVPPYPATGVRIR